MSRWFDRFADGLQGAAAVLLVQQSWLHSIILLLAAIGIKTAVLEASGASRGGEP